MQSDHRRKFREYILDSFQVSAIESIENNHSVVVSAATGSGKTLIADYIIDKTLGTGKRVIYTAPIKALSNQKYRDFKACYGADSVGILTGDVQINSSAQIVIMTTEIYRNMLISKDVAVADVSYVIFDEIHYISDWERGTVWEESIIFSPEHIRFLCLSATIPNAKEFASWISSIKNHDVDVVVCSNRAVPLEKHFFDSELGITTLKRIKDVMSIPHYDAAFRRGRGRRKIRFEKSPLPNHLELIGKLEENNWLPAIFFAFSRMLVEKKAKELALKKDFTKPSDRENIIKIFNAVVPSDLRNMASVKMAKKVVLKGVGIHHAGLMPKIKEAVEILFADGLLKVLYATETFAVGINMPARTVCFNSLEKYDGISFRYLTSKEYFQLAGRAGRRGIDNVGYAISMIDRNTADIKKIDNFTSRDVDPIRSQFKLSFNTAINLFATHSPSQVEMVLKSSFDYYIRKSHNAQIRVMASYNNKIKKFEKYGYIKKGKLTDKGEFLRHIYTEELLVGEIFAGTFWKRLSPVEMCVIAGAIIYEPRRNDRFEFTHGAAICRKLVGKLQKELYIRKQINTLTLKRLGGVVSLWAAGKPFTEIIKLTNLQEGDLIRLFRQILDLLRQVRRASQNGQLDVLVDNCIGLLDRDVVKVEL